jgi:Fe-S-cluster containining protein
LTEERKKIITAYLENQGKNAQHVFSCADYSFPSVDKAEFCVFNDQKTKKCSVHEVKPETCRAGPITFDINFRTGKVEWYLKERGLCLFAGVLFDAPEKLDEHLRIAKNELMQLICNLGAEDLRAILKRDEPQTFKIGEDDLPKDVQAKLGLNL